MSTNTHTEKAYKGILSGLAIRMHRTRLGELLVLDGHISPKQLQHALAISRNSGRQLGRVLVDEQFIDYATIRKTLVEQFMLRMMMAVLTVFISFTSMGLGAKQARAGAIKDVPARVAFQQVAAIAPLGQFPKLFGSTEKESRSLSAFTKWTSMFEKFDAQLNTASGQQSMDEFRSRIEFLRGLPLNQMVNGVNEVMNKVRYVNDINLYGKSDYWATPVEFLKNGGDCEDYAIAKYVALRALGVPEERMRIMILQDLQKNIPHAILIVYTDNGPVLLDNQIRSVTPVERVSHYKPIFSINRTSWWLHTKPKNDVTTVASAAR